LKRIDWLNAWIDRQSKRRISNISPRETDQEINAVIIGYGPIGRTIYRVLQKFGIPAAVIDMDVDLVTSLKAEGRFAIYGDGGRPDLLEKAGLSSAEFLVITISDVNSSHGIILAAREINPNIKIFARSRYLRNCLLLEEAGATSIAYEEAEVASVMAERI